jgi:hypothetical protein
MVAYLLAALAYLSKDERSSSQLDELIRRASEFENLWRWCKDQVKAPDRVPAEVVARLLETLDEAHNDRREVERIFGIENASNGTRSANLSPFIDGSALSPFFVPVIDALVHAVHVAKETLSLAAPIVNLQGIRQFDDRLARRITRVHAFLGYEIRPEEWGSTAFNWRCLVESPFEPTIFLYPSERPSDPLHLEIQVNRYLRGRLEDLLQDRPGIARNLVRVVQPKERFGNRLLFDVASRNCRIADSALASEARFRNVWVYEVRMGTSTQALAMLDNYYPGMSEPLYGAALDPVSSRRLLDSLRDEK